MENVKQCVNCKRDFTKKTSHSKEYWARAKFCSRSCAKIGVSSWNKGIPLSEERKLHLSEVLNGRTCNTGRTHFKKGNKEGLETQFKKGQTSYWKGKPNPNFQGENNPRWKGGITPEHKMVRWSQKYKDFRDEIFERDNYTCNDCGRKRKPGDRVVLNVHHKKSFSEYKELRFVKSNVVTLCKECHKLKHKLIK
jgi:5-methylcytosine-specific restriction endonuclease McrA